MSEQDSKNNTRTTAEMRRGWWPGWIWAVPIAALLIVGWLGFRELTRGGQEITISFDNAHGIQPQNTAIEYRGMQVGTVNSVSLGSKGQKIVVGATIDNRAIGFLKSGTRFWLEGTNPSLSNLSSLGALLSGPTIMMAPGSGKSATHFKGLARKPIAPSMTGNPKIYEISFMGSVGALQRGDPVKLRGFTVGAVHNVGFRYDAQTGQISTPVTLALYPSLFHIHDAANPQGKAALAAAIGHLIHQGLRARLERDPPLIGSYRVSLEMVPGASAPARKRVDGVPQIPTAPGGGLNALVAHLDKAPVDQIAQNILDVTHHVDQIVASPKLRDSLAQLDAALRQIHNTAAKAGPNLAALIAELRRTSQQLDAAAKSADKTLGGVPSQNGLHKTLREITEAARSVRELANYLDRHPDALINGRSGG